MLEGRLNFKEMGCFVLSDLEKFEKEALIFQKCGCMYDFYFVGVLLNNIIN